MKREHIHCLSVGVALALAACGGEPVAVEELVEGAADAVDSEWLGGEEEYISAGSVEALKVPPDLALPDTSDQMLIPELASGVSIARSSRGRLASVLPEFLEIKMRKEGTVRWLEVGADPVTLWPHTKEFWEEQGFEVVRDEPIVGVLETAWRRRVDQPYLDEAQDDRYYAEMREKYLMRMEREPNAYTNIYVSRYGLEVAGVDDARKVVWQAGMADPEREVEMLSRLTQHLGGAEIDAVASLDEEGAADSVRLDLEYLDGATPILRIEDDFSSVWRQVGVALGRTGLSVQEQDRSAGSYLVSNAHSEGKEQAELEIHLLDRGEEMTIVTVHSADANRPPPSPRAARDVLRHVVAAYALTPREASEEE